MPRELVKVEGLKELQRDIARLRDKELKKELRSINRQAATTVKEAARPPRRSGALARSVGVKAGLRDAAIKAGSPSRVPYAGPIHYGWPRRSIAPQPFLSEALDRSFDRVRDTYERSIHALAKRVLQR